MTSSENEEWTRIDELFRVALERTGEGRDRFVEELRERSPEIGDAVAGLLDAAVASERFLEEPIGLAKAVDLDGLVRSAEEEARSVVAGSDRVGELVGPFRLIERIGRGGMATVYRAERADDQWEYEVAIKLIRRGLDTDDVIDRFRAERQILSSLRHPNIARLVDGGTTGDGLPFLAMELVHGQPITEAADARGLELAERLKLFEKVARAVQHAHQHLVIHRDLKPSNVLLDSEGEPHLLDFGIAKVLDGSESARTATGVLVLTPDYASPEQLRGDPITTAADVFQLGVLLSLLLTGRRPWDGMVPKGAVSSDRRYLSPSKLATEEAARRIGTERRLLARLLRGDLGAIVRQATADRPEDRYSSAEALADDVVRYLEGRPVAARAGGWSYTASKWARRHPWVPTVAAAAVVAIVAYGVTLRTYSTRLEEERNAARIEAERAQETQAVLVDLFRRPDPYGDGATAGVRDVTLVDALDGGADRIRTELDGRPAVQADLLGALADVYTNLGMGAQSQELLSESLERAREAEMPSEIIAFRMRKLGRTLVDIGQIDSARAVLVQGLEQYPALSDTATAHLLHQLGRAEAADGRFESAEVHFTEALTRAESAGALGTRLTMDAHAELSNVYANLDDVETALMHAETALASSIAMLGPEHASSAVKQVAVAAALLRVGRHADGVSAYQDGIQALDAAFGPEHVNVLRARQSLALALGRAGELEGAEVELRSILSANLRRFGERSSESASTLQNLGTNLKSQGRYDDAWEVLLRAREAFVASRTEGHYLAALPLLTMAEIQLSRGLWTEVEVLSRDAHGTLTSGLPAGHYITAVAACRWARGTLGRGPSTEALGRLRDAVSILTASASAPPEYVEECSTALAEASGGLD